MRIVKDGYGLIIGSASLIILGGFIAVWGGWGMFSGAMLFFGLFAVAFFIYFFRDPDRNPPVGEDTVVSGADGLVRAIEPVHEGKYLNADTIRVSIFLNPFDVHVNRAPLGGVVKELAYTPGRHLLTIRNASSEQNEHSSILIHGQRTRCLVKQIVGPVVRRVVYWLEMEQTLSKGDRIGMMKFGSRMDIYLPAAEVEVLVSKGDRVRAGETVIARVT